MKNIWISFLLLTMVTLGGCTHFEERLKYVAVSTKQDVFQEALENLPIPAGYADIRIVASLKTHKPGMYLFENSPHGTPDYLLLLNIDGQAIKVKGELVEEEIPYRAERDPEAGRGIRYTFNRSLRVKSGPHKISIALPVDAVIVEYDIELHENTRNILEIQPIYGKMPGKQRPGFYNVTSFLEGIKELRGYLNGIPLNSVP